MAALTRRYQDVSPVTLHVEAGVVSSTLYCGEVAGLSGGLVESFLVELYRCKLCQFTCGLKASISSHLLLKHRPPTFTYLGGADGGDRADNREETGLQRGASPYQLVLNEESKQSDEDEDFLLYNMLGNMSPSACDISTEGGLQVAHTCEVSTLFVEENTMFPLKGGPVDLSCAIDPSNTQEEMAQSAHLMTLGLCRISATKPPPPSASKPVCHSSEDRPPIEDRPSLSESLKSSGTNGGPSRTPSGRRSLVCLLCPLTLPSQRLLDIHVRSHRAGGGFRCVCCSWMADRWDQVELHWRSHCRRKRRRREEQQKKKTEPHSSCVPQQTPEECHQHSDQSDRTRRILVGRPGRKQENNTNRSGPRHTSRSGPSQTSSCCSGPPDRRKTRTTDKKEDEETGFRCSLCHRKFSSKLTLRRHLGVHGGEKPYNCPHCSYRSRLKASLLQHLRTHTGEKPFRCGQCSYASIDSSSLLRHIRTHSQEKPYRCQLCDYSSIQKKSLDLHARRHHTGEAFPCQHCQYSSPDRQLLLRHVRRHHTPS